MVKLYKFFATWCGPCRVLSTRLEGFKACDVEELDIDDEKSYKLAAKFGIRSVPTMVLINDEGKELKRWVGLQDAKEVEKEVNELKNA